MRRISLKTLALTLAAATLVVAVAATRTVATAESQAPAAQALQSIGPLAFGPDGVLFAADRQAATIYAIDLAAKATGGAPGAKDVTGIDTQIASMLGTDPKEVQITDLAVHPKTRNAFISVMRGTGADAKPALLRVDGAGKIEVVALDGLKMTKATMPNAPAAAAAGQQRNPRMESITDMAFVDGKLVVAGLSNEEFASKLRTVPVSVRGSRCRHERRDLSRQPRAVRDALAGHLVRALPDQQHLAPDRRLHLHAAREVPGVEPGAGPKVMGTTIAELGNRNRPTDMIVYKKGGKDYLLIANTSRGVMKVPTDGFATAPGITARVASETGGVGFEAVAALKGVEQLDLLDDQRAIVLTRAEGGVLSLQAIALP